MLQQEPPFCEPCACPSCWPMFRPSSRPFITSRTRLLRLPGNRFSILPRLGIPLAGWVSRRSRHSRDQRKLDGDLLVREIARPRFAEGHDAVMIGHFHHAFEHHENGRDFMVLGDWIERFTYAVLEHGRLRLERWPLEGAQPGLDIHARK